MINNKKETNYLIESCISGVIKRTIGRGPEKTKVEISGQIIFINIKGILSEVEKTALRHEENVERVLNFRKGLQPILKKEIMEGISNIINKDIEIISEEENIIKNTKCIMINVK